MLEDWMPHDDPGRESWCSNFLREADVVAAALGIPDDELNPLKLLAQAWLTAYAKVKKAKTDFAAAVTEQEAAFKIFNEPIRKFVRQVKASPKATPQLLEDLQVMGSHSDPTARVDAGKPALTLKPVAGGIDVTYHKYGHDGIELLCRRGTETVFTSMGRFTKSPIKDRRANLIPGQAEHRDFCAWYIKNDEWVGEQGDIVAIAIVAQPA